MDDGDLRLGGMTTEETEKVLQLQDLTGIEEVAICRDVLQRHGWDLEVAVQDQLNIREGRPSMFSVSARSPTVVADSLAQQFFAARPRDDDHGGGITGLFRYVVNLVFKVCYGTVATVFNFALQFIRPDPRRLLTDPLADVMAFASTFDEKYGPEHPVFYQGTYAQAVNDAKQELKFLLIFLHDESYPDSENICRNALTNSEVISIINQNMLFWACSAITGEGYRVSHALRERSYPFFAVIVMFEGRMTVVARMKGAVDGPELARRLRKIMRDYEGSIVAARVDRMERSFNQSLRAQQDEAFEESLRVDQEKERGRREADRMKQAEEDECRKLQLEESQRKQRVEELKMELVSQIPQEPCSTDPDSVHLVIKLPSGSRLERKFLKTHSLKDVHNFVFCHPKAPDSFEIASNFPKRKLDTQSDITLEAAGIQRGEVLFVYDLDA